MACLSNGNSSSSPATTSSMTKFPNVSCDRVVWRWLTRHDLPSRRSWVQKKSLQSSMTGTLPEEVVWQGPAMLWQGPGRRARLWRDFFWTQVRREGNTYPGNANTRSHFGPCNSLRCEMAPWRDWTSLTFKYGRSLWRGTYLWNTVLARFPVSNTAPVNVNKYLMSF